MIGARELSQKLHLLSQNLPNLLVESLNDLSLEIISLQKDQFNAGLSSDGNDFSTSIIEDDFFKSKESALRYARYKIKNPVYQPKYSIFKERDFTSPNLILSDGNMVYNKLGISVENNSLVILLESPILAELQSKYGDFLGLSPIAFKFFREEIFIPYLAEKIEKDVM